MEVSHVQAVRRAREKAQKLAHPPLEPFTITVNGKEQLLQLNPAVDIFLPNVMEVTDHFDPENPKHRAELERVLQETKTIGVVAHQDDLEIGMPQAIYDHVKQRSPFLGVVVTDSPSISTEGTPYTNLSETDFANVRNLEQRMSAKQAGFPVIQLKYPSSILIKDGKNAKEQKALAGDLLQTFDLCSNAATIYTHNPLDMQQNHINVLAATVAALQGLKKPILKQKTLYGVEVWGKGVQAIGQEAHTSFPLDEEALKLTHDLIGNYRSQSETQNRDYAEGVISGFRNNGVFTSGTHQRENSVAGAAVALDLSDYLHIGKKPHEMASDLMDKMTERVRRQFDKVPNFPQHVNGMKSKFNEDKGRSYYAVK